MTTANTGTVSYLTETQLRELDYGTLTPGYIRHVIKLNLQEIPKEIIDECAKFSKPINVTNEKDHPTNFISSKDIEISENYKIEGNQYFKFKDYATATVKYTTALKFNPNNHLIYSNRAYCYYLLKNYNDAFDDIKVCINIRPTFAKCWYRYGIISEKHEKYGLAGIAFRTAYYLSMHMNQESNTNPYKIHYDKYLKYLEDQQNVGAIKYINSFDQTTEKSDPDESNMMNAIMKNPKFAELLNKMQNQQDYDHDDIFKIQEMMEEMDKTNDMSTHQDIHDFEVNVCQAKCYYLIENDQLKFDSNEENYCWIISWSSTSQIYHNKRVFCINIHSKNGMVINTFMHQYCIPDADQLIYLLFRSMAYCNLIKQVCIKPRRILFAHRMKNEFFSIQKAMNKLRIQCLIESEKRQLEICKANKTNAGGWNHL